jgi:nickel/cobalt exporter
MTVVPARLMGSRLAQSAAACVLCIVLVPLICAALDPALAQLSPFGTPRPQGAPTVGGLLGWIFAKQAEFYRQFSGMMRAINVIEILSYSLIVLIGVRLLFVKGRAFVNLLQTLHRPAPLGAAATPAHLAHDHHYHHDHHGSCCEHRHEHDHAHDEEACAWGHAHAPEPVELAGPGGWRRGLSAIVAVGLRPCSGAILVLIFALAQGLFWAGVVSTLIMGLGTAITVALIATLAVAAKGWARRLAESRSGYGMLVMRGIEAGAAVIIIGFGAMLLSGYLVAERMIGI